MESETPINPTANTSNDLIARADEQLARVRERIASADEDIARATGQLSRIEWKDTRDASDKPRENAGSSTAAPGPGVPRVKATPGSVGLLGIGLALTACLVVAVLVSQLSRDSFALVGGLWKPKSVSTSVSPPTDPQPAPTLEPAKSVDSVKAEAAPVPAAPIAKAGVQDTAPQDAAPADAKVSELIQLQQAMARDVAGLKQAIEQLKARQDQIAADNSRAIEQLKAKQEEMAGQSAKISAPSAAPVTPSAAPVTLSPPSAAQIQSPQVQSPQVQSPQVRSPQIQSPPVRIRPRAPPLRPRRNYPPPWEYYDDGW